MMGAYPGIDFPINRVECMRPIFANPFACRPGACFVTWQWYDKRTKPIHIPALGAPAQVLKFLDYLLESPQPGILVGSRVLRVTIPDPARFAVHKLLISRERPSTEHAKTRKDLQQAAMLLHVLLEDRPGDVRHAWYDAGARGRNWSKRLDQACAALPDEVQEALSRENVK